MLIWLLDWDWFEKVPLSTAELPKALSSLILMSSFNGCSATTGEASALYFVAVAFRYSEPPPPRTLFSAFAADTECSCVISPDSSILSMSLYDKSRPCYLVLFLYMSFAMLIYFRL